MPEDDSPDIFHPNLPNEARWRPRMVSAQTPSRSRLVRFARIVMARAAPNIMKALSLFGNEFPRVFPGRKRKLQHAKSIPFADFAIRCGKTEKIVAAPSSPYHNFSNSIGGIGFAFRVLRRETFIGVFMSGKNQVGVGSVQVFP